MYIIISLQAINQMSYLVFLDNNDGVSKIEMGKIDCYLSI